MYDHAVLHYSEIGTKSGNRPFFEKALVRNVAGALSPYGDVNVRREPGRITFPLGSIAPGQHLAAIAAVARLPGVAWVSPARRTEPTMDALREAVVEVASAHEGSFKINARRSDKTLPFRSRDMNVELGAAVQAAGDRPVDVHHPDVEYRVEVDSRRGYVYDRRWRGPGGLPVGVSGKVISLMSGGIDSPVACYLMMLRGCRVEAVHLWNRSFSGEGVHDKALDLGRVLATYQGGFRLHLVPFEDIQREIIAMAPAEVRMLLYRRAMLRVANVVRGQEGALATVLGDAVGQVASQTLQNLGAVYEAGDPPVIAPLAGQLKIETVGIAEKIGTFEVSIRPAEDCCGLLVAKHPATRTTAQELREHEALYDLDALIGAALESREIHELQPNA